MNDLWLKSNSGVANSVIAGGGGTYSCIAQLISLEIDCFDGL